jgi:biopolymer transport protein ExbD
MAMAAGPQKGFRNEINVTPLVDVVLVLLIIFMVVTPMLQRGKDVQLPQAKLIDEKDEGDPLILSVTLEKTTWVEHDQYDEAGLSARLSMEFRAQPGRKVLVKGDTRLTFGDVRKVMEIARKAGAKSVALAVEELKE